MRALYHQLEGVQFGVHGGDGCEVLALDLDLAIGSTEP
jgi:hypothetical protein